MTKQQNIFFQSTWSWNCSHCYADTDDDGNKRWCGAVEKLIHRRGKKGQEWVGLSSLHANAGRGVLQRALCLFILTAGALQTRPKLQRERERERLMMMMMMRVWQSLLQAISRQERAPNAPVYFDTCVLSGWRLCVSFATTRSAFVCREMCSDTFFIKPWLMSWKWSSYLHPTWRLWGLLSPLLELSHYILLHIVNVYLCLIFHLCVLSITYNQ